MPAAPPWLSLGTGTLLPRISLVLAASRGPSGAHVLGYVTATFTLDRAPWVTGARTTFARTIARHHLSDAAYDEAFARQMADPCLSPAERRALARLWRQAP